MLLPCSLLFEIADKAAIISDPAGRVVEAVGVLSSVVDGSVPTSTPDWVEKSDAESFAVSSSSTGKMGITRVC